ncbi:MULTISPECIES: RNA polymerase sigma factor [unclassified Nitrobacter]|jgi:RNA polymerase sigma-70 factor (ECF subfamily)|uniref:RNA polymerase sigma factor n=1 Tax=unclassified Nitrobacter TaxID=2620411 RepID=UPI000926C7F7|nr:MULTISPECIES: RNA polymerase sigma factor [unclassified Nitrobacter]MBN9146799.1 RNA polymerase sigma factor [Nitrobacter sp.]OJV01189.1 MAG: RNA polymerase subunit sigma-70 [Nitrobacter sp. 62-23]
MSDLTTNLAALYADEQGKLQRLLMRQGMSRTAAADLVQEAFLRLLGAPRDDVRDLRSYLFRTTRNLSVDHARQRRRNTISNAVELDENIVDPAPLPDAVLISRQEFQALHAALADLPPRCREVLILHKFEGLSYAEIADRLGVAKNTVTVHMVKAVSCLKARFSKVSLPGG